MNIQAVSSNSLIFLFLLCTVIIWLSGIQLTKAIDAIIKHYHLGEAFGGLVFLSIVTNLPEIAITGVAAFHKDYDIAISNLLGGIAIQTVVLVLIDIFGVGRSAPLTEKGHSKILIIEGLSLIFILCMVLIASLFPSTFIYARTTPFEWIILMIWLGTIYITTTIFKSNKNQAHSEIIKSTIQRHPSKSIANPVKALWILGLGAVLTLLAGWGLVATGETLTTRWGMSGVLFGGTILALCTALPEISTGIASAKIRDYNMAVSDIFGGNAFLPVLFLMASMISGDAILPNLKPSDIYLTVLGIILTGVYMLGMVLHSKKQIGRMGIDSLVVVIIYFLGLWGLIHLI